MKHGEQPLPGERGSSGSSDDSWAHLIDRDFQHVLFYNLMESHVRRTYHYRHLFALMLVVLAALFALGMYVLWKDEQTSVSPPSQQQQRSAARDRLVRHALESQSKLEQAWTWGGGGGGSGASSSPSPLDRRLMMQIGHSRSLFG